jgi:hypothetical protein
MMSDIWLIVITVERVIISKIEYNVCVSCTCSIPFNYLIFPPSLNTWRINLVKSQCLLILTGYSLCFCLPCVLGLVKVKLYKV